MDVAGPATAIYISSNPQLANLDSLLNFKYMGKTADVTVTDNPSLTKGCGLWTLFHNTPIHTATFSGNGTGVTYQEIIAAGPCQPEPTVCDGDITLSSQADVDAFASRGCSTMTGKLTVSGSDITNLDGLSGLTSVRALMLVGNPVLTDVSGINLGYAGALFIVGNTALTNLDGFEELITVDNLGGCVCPFNGVVINDNDNLENINGLSSLSSVGGMIRIGNNSKLTNIDALSSITSVGDNSGHSPGNSIEISTNKVLRSIDGLRSIMSASGGVYIVGNDSLRNLDGLEGFTEIKGAGLFVSDNKSLTDINGLSNVQTVWNTIKISYNDVLPNLNGLMSLTTLAGDGDGEIHIENNAALTNVNSLSNFTTVTQNTRLLRVYINPMLTKGCGLYNLIVNSFSCNDCIRTVDIAGNGEGVSELEIRQGGPCNTGPAEAPPTNLAFSDITDNSMTVSFTAGSGFTGYLTSMRAFESALPDEAPENGAEYHVGNVIGCCSVVVGMGTDTTLNIVYLEPDIDYYFDVIPMTGTDQYRTDLALSGHQRTNPQVQPYPNPFVEEVVFPVTVNDDYANVRIMILDQLGRKVSEVVNERFSKGKHEVRWSRVDMNGNRAVNGVYMYSIITNDNAPMKGMFVAK